MARGVGPLGGFARAKGPGPAALTPCATRDGSRPATSPTSPAAGLRARSTQRSCAARRGVTRSQNRSPQNARPARTARFTSLHQRRISSEEKVDKEKPSVTASNSSPSRASTTPPRRSTRVDSFANAGARNQILLRAKKLTSGHQRLLRPLASALSHFNPRISPAIFAQRPRNRGGLKSVLAARADVAGPRFCTKERDEWS